MIVARAESGLPRGARTPRRSRRRAPRGSRGVRARLLGYLPFFRAFVAIEATLLALAAAIVDALAGDLTARACS